MLNFVENGRGIYTAEAFSDILTAEAYATSERLTRVFFEIPDVVHNKRGSRAEEGLIRLVDSRAQGLYVGSSHLLSRLTRSPFPFDGSLFTWDSVRQDHWHAQSVGLRADYRGNEARYSLVYIGLDKDAWIGGLRIKIPQIPVLNTPVKTCSWA